MNMQEEEIKEKGIPALIFVVGLLITVLIVLGFGFLLSDVGG